MKTTYLKITISILGLLVIIGAVVGILLFTKAKQGQPNLDKEKTGQKTMTLQEKLAAQKEIKKFATYEEMAAFLEKAAQGSQSSYSARALSAPELTDVGSAMEAPTAAPQSFSKIQSDTVAGSSGQTTPDYSRTNIQVEGVDEADIIKTDGHYIYALVRNKLTIIKSLPATESAIVANINFKTRPQELFINGDRLAVFGVDTEFQNTELYRSLRRSSDYTYLSIYDITDRAAPKEIRTLRYEGTYFSSRMIGSSVYLVTNAYHYGYESDPKPLPNIIENNTVLPNTCANGASCFAPDAYYFDIPYESYTLSTLTSVNLNDAASPIKGDVYVLPSAENMYVSAHAAYITYTKHLNEDEIMMEVVREVIESKLTEKERQQIAAIEAAEDFILTRSEKMEKVGRVFERISERLSEEELKNLTQQMEDALKQKYAALADELEKTVIHKISIANGNIEFTASSEVKGTVLNQFSMDENGDYFRIATTKGREWSRFGDDEEEQKSYSNVYVLDAGMNVVGSLEHLAEGERIYSARFMQNRAYLVTFQQTDPLFVIDLAEPTTPKVLGELKIPGFSDYLHPYDDATLIGIGKDTEATESGGVRQKGLKLSLFDVSEVAAPREIDTLVIGESGSDSIAAHDHKAFLFSREKNLLVIPASLLEKKNQEWPEFTFGGALVFNIDKTGFTLRGRIDHSDGGAGSERDWWGGYEYFDNTVKRSLFIDTVLYTFSNAYLKANSLEDLVEIASIPFVKEKIEEQIPPLPAETFLPE